LKQSSLDLGKVMSNSKEILDRFPDEEKAPKFRTINAKDSQALPSTKALGVRWDCEEDNFCFSSRADATPPKNLGNVLSQLASTYDPLQTVGPYLMTGKLLLQQFWHESPAGKRPSAKTGSSGGSNGCWVFRRSPICEYNDGTAFRETPSLLCTLAAMPATTGTEHQPTSAPPATNRVHRCKGQSHQPGQEAVDAEE
jgi:hypothetical protein